MATHRNLPLRKIEDGTWVISCICGWSESCGNSVASAYDLWLENHIKTLPNYSAPKKNKTKTKNKPRSLYGNWYGRSINEDYVAIAAEMFGSSFYQHKNAIKIKEEKEEPTSLCTE